MKFQLALAVISPFPTCYKGFIGLKEKILSLYERNMNSKLSCRKIYPSTCGKFSKIPERKLMWNISHPVFLIREIKWENNGVYRYRDCCENALNITNNI